MLCQLSYGIAPGWTRTSDLYINNVKPLPVPAFRLSKNLAESLRHFPP